MKHLAQFSVGTTLKSGSIFGRRQQQLAEKCKDLLQLEGRHGHWLIYGEQKGAGFRLMRKNYVNGGDVQALTRDKRKELKTVSADDMLVYLDTIAAYRFGSGSSSSSGSLILVGVTGEDDLTLTVDEFYQHMGYELSAELDASADADTENRPRGPKA